MVKCIIVKLIAMDQTRHIPTYNIREFIRKSVNTVNTIKIEIFAKPNLISCEYELKCREYYGWLRLGLPTKFPY